MSQDSWKELFFSVRSAPVWIVHAAASGFRCFSKFPLWNNAASPVREIHNNERTACAAAVVSGVQLHRQLPNAIKIKCTLAWRRRSAMTNLITSIWNT